MGVKFDINKAFENKEVASFFKFIAILLIIAFIGIIIYLSENNKHNKLLGGVELNIPIAKPDSPISKKDSLVINNNQKTEININQHKGDIIIGTHK